MGMKTVLDILKMSDESVIINCNAYYILLIVI